MKSRSLPLKTLSEHPITLRWRPAGPDGPKLYSLPAPNGKIQATIDPDRPEGSAVSLWESDAILLYLAEKSGQFVPADPADRFQVKDGGQRARLGVHA